MKMIQEQENWVPYELKSRNDEHTDFARMKCLARQTRVDLGFLKEPYPGQPDYLDEPRTPARDGKSLPMIFFQNCYLRTILTQRQISR
ncbi:hypothetical protein TNCV_4705292 [Trichonephila clavipes]|nr:hypothetical protein TNCV_4705292 [Trichonephila clavipes]